MSSERLIHFADKSLDPPTLQKPSYQLLALTPALLALVEASSRSSSFSDDDSTATTARLEIRGDPTDSAVLVSATQTFALRGVQNSNSLCVCSSGGGNGKGRGRKGWFVDVKGAEGAAEDEGVEQADEGPARKKRRQEEKGAIEIEAVLHETLEAIPGVARTEKLEGLLKGCEYTGESAEEELGTTNSRNLHTFATLQSRLPASDGEIRTALARHRVVTLSNASTSTSTAYLRPLPPPFLLSILPSLLSTLALPASIAHPPAPPKKSKSKDIKPALPLPSSAAAAAATPLWSEALDADLLDALDAVECGNEEVAGQVLEWFGERVTEGRTRKTWRVDGRKVVKEIGVGLLAAGGFGQQPLAPLLAKWKSLCGGFAPVCDLSLLAGLLLHRPPPLSTLQYLPPSSLSPDPATRFAELFALKPRWLEGEMGLFIDDLTGGDKKKRDALVLKFVRKVKEKGETWWTPRNLWT